MRRVPLLPTMVVALACAAMIALGIWQLQRRGEKEALIARYETNRQLSSDIAYPALAPVPDAMLFRHSRAMCLDPVEWRVSAGRGVNGKSGFRYLALCRTGAEGPGLLADMGVAPQPDLKPDWKGGLVSGIITLEPDSSSVFAKLLGKATPPGPMLVSSTPAPGLVASAPPSTADVPNNHLAYAIQWFLFAGLAALIYALALRRKGHG